MRCIDDTNDYIRMLFHQQKEANNSYFPLTGLLRERGKLDMQSDLRKIEIIIQGIPEAGS